MGTEHVVARIATVTGVIKISLREKKMTFLF